MVAVVLCDIVYHLISDLRLDLDVVLRESLIKVGAYCLLVLLLGCEVGLVVVKSDGDTLLNVIVELLSILVELGSTHHDGKRKLGEGCNYRCGSVVLVESC